MTLFEPGGDPPRPRPSAAARRVSRIALGVSAVLALALVGTFFIDDLPLPVRTWIAQTVPGGHSLVGLAPDPEEEVAAVADRMLLTDEGRLLFAAARPKIVDDVEKACGLDGGEDETMITVGCYHGFGRIYLLRDESRFGDAVMLTAAAHELLHAAYDRLSSAERASLAPLLTAEIERIDPDDPVLRQIEASVGGDERSRATEQFAYLGSEVVLPGGFAPALEEIYARWFTDRESLASGAR